MPIQPEPFADDTLPHRFYTLKQVAAMLATSEAQVYALVRAGDLPAIKIGGRGQWRVENLKLDGGSKGSTGRPGGSSPRTRLRSTVL